MAQTNEIEIKFFSSGYCTSHANIVNPVIGKGKVKFHAVWALLRHARLGCILFDTGYSERFTSVTNKFPGRLYRWATPVEMQTCDSPLELLRREGIAAHEVNYIIVSHFHADHICGLLDFPSAKFICSKTAYEQMVALSGIAAVRKGILKALIPPDFSNRVLFIEDIGELHLDESGLLLYSFFNQGKLKLVSLPGHARGMLGFILFTSDSTLFFATDAAWSKTTFDENILPKKIVKLFFDSWKDFINTQQQIRLFIAAHPHTTLLFTHCPETLTHLSNHV